MTENQSTDFGFERVEPQEKTRRVGEVFSSVASRYDLMNDLMSMGMHRLWKKFTIERASVKYGHNVLDLAGGTGDLAKIFSSQVGDDGQVILADINFSMLNEGRARLVNYGVSNNLSIIQLDGENLSFNENTFDIVTIAFGLRNITDKERALKSIYRTLKPGGKLLILEFSKPMNFLKPTYDLYSFKVLPFLGKMVAKDEDSYKYLAESIRVHPDQKTLMNMMEKAKFERCRYTNLTGGIVALHEGYKF